jgi:Zn-dependent protease with chaperone function
MRSAGTPISQRPSSRAAALRAWGATSAIGLLALASAGFVVVRLVERWRVAPAGASHQLVLLGQTVSYPAANFAAAVVLILGVLGVLVLTLAISGAIREAVASARFAGRMRAGRSTAIEGALVFQDRRPLAFCAGLLRPRIYVSTGALAVLDEPALQAVLRHEQHHRRCRDPLRLAVGRVLSHALFFVPGIAALAREQQALAELAADEWAVAGLSQNRSALARALLTFSDDDSPGMAMGIDGARVDHLLGHTQRWRFPLALCIGAALLLALTVATAALISQFATGSTSLALPLLSKRPCVVVLATLAAAITWIGLRRSARDTT